MVSRIVLWTISFFWNNKVVNSLFFAKQIYTIVKLQVPTLGRIRYHTLPFIEVLDNPNPVAYRNRMHVFEEYAVRCGPKYGTQKD